MHKRTVCGKMAGFPLFILKNADVVLQRCALLYGKTMPD